MRRTQSKLEDTKLDITPLVDCVFLLLIFFMVTTVFSTTPGLRVDLPKAAESDMPPEKDLNIVISKDGELELNGVPLVMEDLERALLEAKEMYRSKVLIIKADKKTYHEVVVDVMDAAKGVGIDELAIATEPEEEEK
ncbi:biopolymer transporter ExbD [bacterium]|nr:biopolymer transporter ExbD [bacterium]